MAEPVKAAAAVSDHLRLYVLPAGIIAVLRDPHAIQERGATSHLQHGEPLGSEISGDRPRREAQPVAQDGQDQDPWAGPAPVQAGEVEASRVLIAETIHR